MTTAWSASWLLEAAIKPGFRAVFVTDVTDADLALQSYAPPAVQGQKPVRLGPGVFGFKNGATLLIWPVNRHVRNLPNIAAPFRVVLDPSILSGEIAPFAMTVSYVVRWGLNEASTVEMGLTCTAKTEIVGSEFSFASRAKVPIQAIRSHGSDHLTMPYVCGTAAGMLLQSKVGKWLAMPQPETIVLCDALGRRYTQTEVMPVAEISAMGKKFRLCAEVQSEIRFNETHG